jgi:uncharacterized coiled-coil protein SlyX
MNAVLREKSLDWALAHVCRFADSDHFARIFEFHAIQKNWKEVRDHMLSLDLEAYVPQAPLMRFAPRLNGTHRIVHRLDPIDTLIYTALVHQIYEAAEGPRDPEPMRAAASRVEASADGSFFKAARSAWQRHLDVLGGLARKFKGGYVLMADIFDFFGQIQPRLLGPVLAESRSIPGDLSQTLIRFLLALSPSTSRGIPTGPAASAVLAEAIGANIDREISRHTRDFARWVDDIHIFFRSRQEAHDTMLSLSAYLEQAHKLVFAPEKTRVVPVEEYLAGSHKGLADETAAAGQAEERLGQLAGDWRPAGHYYGWSTAASREPMPGTLCAQLRSVPEYQKVEDVYLMHFNQAMKGKPPDLMTARRIIRKAAGYRIRNLIPGVLEHFDHLMPVIRETAIYLKAVLDKNDIRTYEGQFKKAWQNKQQSSSYVNDWMCHVFSHPDFNQIDIPADYGSLVGVRNKALIALRKRDVEWVRKLAAHMDGLDPWERRAILYASSILPPGERAGVLDPVLMRGTILERSVALYVQSAGQRATGAGSPRAGVSAPDNYPSYGDKGVDLPDNMKMMEEIEGLALQLADQAKILREQQAAIAENRTALDHKDVEIKSLGGRVEALEQTVNRLLARQKSQAK